MPSFLPFVAALAVLVAGCAAAPPAVGPDTAGSCRPIDPARFAGRPATAEVGAAMLRESGARTLRWVAFGSMITMEFSPDRLTVRLDSRNQVESATCG